ncbi:MAG: DNA polymerase III subunit delta' [Halochromatium sp.]|nr:DNA polymerase III subunit delta' [Halochromatium sp.]
MAASTPLLEPMPPWLDATWLRLREAHRHARLGQALLISGPLGVGKRLLADHFARLLFCTAPDADGNPCGTCADCHLLATGHHPDRLLLEPDADGASGEIRAEQVRQLCARETLTPMRGATKVLMVVPADAMNLFAANSLLKTLEEPVESTVWMLITEQPQRLSQTIRSRCQQINLTSPPATQALPWLESRLLSQGASTVFPAAHAGSEGPAEPAARCLALAQGAPLRALALAETGALEQRQRLLDDLINVARGERDPLAVANDWQRHEPSLALGAMIDGLMDVLRLAVDPTGARIINLGARDALAALVAQTELVAAHRLLQILLQARASIDAPLNRQILFEALLVRWACLARSAT